MAITKHREIISLTKSKEIIFFQPPQQNENNTEDEHSETGSDHDVHDSVELASIQSPMASMNDKMSVQLGTTSDAENVEVPRELQSDLDGPHWTNGQAGPALSYGDETFMAEQAWDLINQDHLDEHPVDDNNQVRKAAYGMLAISDADTDV